MKRLTDHGHWRFVIVVVLAIAYLITIQFITPEKHTAKVEPTPPPAPKMTEEQALKVTRLALSSVFLEGYYSSLIQSGKDTKEWSKWGDDAANALLTGDRKGFDKMMRDLVDETEKENEDRKGSRL